LRLTTWHPNDRLDEALWFWLHAAWPDSAYEQTCTAWLAVAEEKEGWSKRTLGWLKRQNRARNRKGNTRDTRR
jgi:hypothetical protein